MDPVRHPLPSTYDCFPSISGAQDDPVLDTLHNAMERYAEDGGHGHYVTRLGEVCAGGALMVVDKGFVKRAIEYVKGRALTTLDKVAPEAAIDYYMDSDEFTIGDYETWAADATKEAIKLLNESAVELYDDEFPTMKDSAYPFGAVEWLNEELPTTEERAREEGLPSYRDAVLKVYEHAIAKREGTVVEA